MQFENGSPPTPPVSVKTLDVVRCKDGQSIYILSLSDAIRGMMTHWGKDRSAYCPPEDCRLCKTGAEQFWKGYIAAKVYNPLDRTWRCAVVELTEFAEAMMRADYRSGQVWQLTRAAKKTKKDRPPVIPQLIETRDLPRIPVWDFLPVLRTFFHVKSIDLSVKNPREAPLTMAVTNEAPPQIGALKEKQEKPPSAEEIEKRKEKTKEFLKRFGTLPSGNGAPHPSAELTERKD